ncbi:hypothetical protein BDQ12DRAFT_685058 [Crucibulum laeve]|uniref:Uncharacterized protein n=1 Tax=Crucibulum laeve TaxID=68775 RepID=A0A5C3M928_9AGAR|nr:hypothetical protein BDQ12DRAFT_685058 [Crucibulum laeve]
MVNRRSKPQKIRGYIDDIDDDYALAASQQSHGDLNDDHGLELVLAKHYAAARGKKRVEKERGFLSALTSQIKQDVSAPVEDTCACIQAVEELFSQFLLNYAATEDKIVTLWSKVRQEQENITLLTERHHASSIKMSKKIEEGHIAGLSKARTACQAFQVTIDQVIPCDL